MTRMKQKRKGRQDKKKSGWKNWEKNLENIRKEKDRKTAARRNPRREKKKTPGRQKAETRGVNETRTKKTRKERQEEST